jgi:hypothetical protein
LVLRLMMVVFGLAQIRMFASAFTTARAELAERDVELLLGWAVTLPVIQFQDVIKQWESLCDDELGDTTSEDAAHQKRSFRWFGVHGVSPWGWSLRGVLDTLAVKH